MSFASQQVARLETLIQQCTGVKSVTVDGQAVTYETLTEQGAESHTIPPE